MTPNEVSAPSPTVLIVSWSMKPIRSPGCPHGRPVDWLCMKRHTRRSGALRSTIFTLVPWTLMGSSISPWNLDPSTRIRPRQFDIWMPSSWPETTRRAGDGTASKARTVRFSVNWASRPRPAA